MAAKKIERIDTAYTDPTLPGFFQVVRVAAYARVSTASDEQENSLEAQIDFYSKFIKTHANWVLVGIYADRGISGTNYENRERFLKMIDDALNHKIDLILAKSISRFSRNTVDSLRYIRSLKAAGVAVYFQKEDINTMDAKGEFMITLMSCFAQEESRSISENVKWGFRKRMKDGIYYLPYAHFLGYDKGPKGQPVINEDQAKIIRLIYVLALYGRSVSYITNFITDLGVPSPANKSKWCCSCTKSILENEKYAGNALLQKTFVPNYLVKKTKKNEGELPQYYVESGHEAIIPPAVWADVQEINKNRSIVDSCTSVFTSRLCCGSCGREYGRVIRSGYYKTPVTYYRCRNQFNKKIRCKNPIIYAEPLQVTFAYAVLRQFEKYPGVKKAILGIVNGIVNDAKRRTLIKKAAASISFDDVGEDNELILIRKAVYEKDKSITFHMLDGKEVSIPTHSWKPLQSKGRYQP